MIATLKHLTYTLKIPQEELNIALNDIDKCYYRKDEIKLDGKGNPKLRNGFAKIRVLYPSKRLLKRIQNRILTNILETLPLPAYAHGSIKGKSNTTNSKKHQGKKYIFSTDISAFFPYINNKMVFDMFRSHGFSRDVSTTLTMLTTYKGELPQGTPTSPIIANLVFAKTGDVLQEFAKANSLTFTTYVDDITFSSPKCFKEKTPEIFQIINNAGFKIAQGKTTYKTKFPKVTGIIVKNNGLDLTFKYKNSINDPSKSLAQIKGIENYISRVHKA